MHNMFEALPVELIADILVPRQNWLEILSLAKPEWLLFTAALPNLPSRDWEEAFKRRFLPGWQKWKKESGWKEVFLKMLHRTWHRSHTSCTSDEAWTKYIILNRNGSANELETSSRNYNPINIFNEFKLQNNLAHLETHVRLVVEFADVRIIALGVLHKPRSSFSVNRNARILLHPPGMDKEDHSNDDVVDPEMESESDEWSSARSIRSSSSAMRLTEAPPSYSQVLHQMYRPLTHPMPAPSHAKYPFYTSGGGDKRWFGTGESEEGGRQWIGGLMLTAQLIGPRAKDPFADGPHLQDMDLVVGPGRSQYASFTWPDLAAIAPWVELTKKIDGQGLGI